MKRWGQYFDHADLNRNGFIDMDDMLELSDNLHDRDLQWHARAG